MANANTASAHRAIPASRIAGACLVVFAALLITACGGGSSSSKHIQPPLVRAFSPFMSPIDFNTLQQTPTFTDGALTVSTDPSYPGKIVIYFQSDTVLNPASVFTGGRPELGVDLSALSILRFIPGSGNVPLALADVTVEPDRIICTPAVLPLVDGQYSVGVFKNIRNTDGKSLVDGPVFHSFTVGAADTVAPFVVTSDPANNEIGIGAGAPAPMPPSGAADVAEVRTNIFGDTSPPVTVRFNEGIQSARVSISNISVIDAGIPPALIAAGVNPSIAPAPTFPKLKSVSDGATLPSNGHEILWQADPNLGGFPFGTIIQVTVYGLYDTQASADAGGDPDNAAPIADLAGNSMLVNYKFQFQTLAPPDLPQNPFPEYAVWWAAADRIGALDTVNQQGTADSFTGAVAYPFGVPRNVVPQFTDTVCNAQNVPGFEPTELSIDAVTNGGNCSTYIYAISPNSGQIVIVNSRTSIPVAIIDTPQPGGIGNNTGGAGAANVLVVSNSSANTLTTFDVSNVTVGLTYLNGPIFIQNIMPTGNTPRAVSVSGSGAFNRDSGGGGPPAPIVMWADFTDGVVNTAFLKSEGPVTSINLGPDSAPNDISMSPYLNPPGLWLAAISQGGLPGEGQVAYYISGPGGTTGISSGITADSIVGSLTGFDGPAGLDMVLPISPTAWWAMAESGAEANRVQTLGLGTGSFNTPQIVETFEQVGANPVAVAHPTAWSRSMCIDFVGAPWICSTNPGCWYNGTEQQLTFPSAAPAQDLYICARGASQVTVVNMVTGLREFYSPVSIPGIRFIATPATQ